VLRIKKHKISTAIVRYCVRDANIKKPAHQNPNTDIKQTEVRHTNDASHRHIADPLSLTNLLFAVFDATPLLALRASDDGTSTHQRNFSADILRVEVCLAKGGLDDVRWHVPERGQDVECAGVVAAERT
jgi:hypothetical protein